MKSLFFAACMGLSASVAIAGCALDAGPGETTAQTGTVRMDLTATGTSGAVYRLRNATFSINTSPPTTLSSESNPLAPTLQAQLPAGSYLITLNPGWFLERVQGMTVQQVNAQLTSSNPAMFGIQSNTTTNLNFQFSTNGTIVNMGPGTLNLGIGVTELDAGAGQTCQLFGLPTCPANSWCGPSPTSPSQGLCQPFGMAPVGGMCGATVLCVSGAICNAGICRNICNLGAPNACASTMQTCTPQPNTMSWGLCL